MKRPIRIGLIGPGRRRNGTGMFVADYLHKEGATIVSVCGSTESSSRRAAEEIGSTVGHHVNSFASLEPMFATHPLDAVAICSPAVFHEAALHLALKAGVHAFCEKPLIQIERPDLVCSVKTLCRAFHARGLVLHQNAQWTYLLEDMIALLDPESFQKLRRFEMFMAPPLPGLEMFREAISHPASLLVKLGATGRVSQARAEFEHEFTVLSLEFLAERSAADPLEAKITFRAQAAQPRPCYLKFDAIRIDREVLSLSPYRLALRTGGRAPYPIADPVQRSLHHFLAQCQAGPPAFDDQVVAQFRLIYALREFLPACLPGHS